MSLVSAVSDLAARVADEFNSIRTQLAGKADDVHEHTPLLVSEVVDPGAPLQEGQWHVYMKSDGKFYAKDWLGNEWANVFLPSVGVVERLVARASTNANTLAGNEPALIVGPADGNHLRADGNEIVSMANASTQGTLILNAGGTVNLGGKAMKKFAFGSEYASTNASGQYWINHGMGVTPTAVSIQVRNSGYLVGTIIENKDANTIRVRLIAYNNNVIASNGRDIDWIAYA